MHQSQTSGGDSWFPLRMGYTGTTHGGRAVCGAPRRRLMADEHTPGTENTDENAPPDPPVSSPWEPAPAAPSPSPWAPAAQSPWAPTPPPVETPPVEAPPVEAPPPEAEDPLASPDAWVNPLADEEAEPAPAPSGSAAPTPGAATPPPAWQVGA